MPFLKVVQHLFTCQLKLLQLISGSDSHKGTLTVAKCWWQLQAMDNCSTFPSSALAAESMLTGRRESVLPVGICWFHEQVYGSIHRVEISDLQRSLMISMSLPYWIVIWEIGITLYCLCEVGCYFEFFLARYQSHYSCSWTHALKILCCKALESC